MSLKGYRIPIRIVTTMSADGEVDHEVRGLGVEALMALVQAQGDVLRNLYVRAANGEFDESDTVTLLTYLLDEAPLLVGLIIAFGVGEPDEWETAITLPFEDQVKLLEAIFELTFEKDGGIKKLLGIISKVWGEAKALPGVESAPSQENSTTG